MRRPGGQVSPDTAVKSVGEVHRPVTITTKSLPFLSLVYTVQNQSPELLYFSMEAWNIGYSSSGLDIALVAFV